MYKKHPQFYEIDPAQKLWKYLDLFKYLDLIYTQSLFMLRVDKFNDKFDGKGHDELTLHSVFQDVFPNNNDNSSFKNAYVNTNLVMGEIVRSESYASSWHINDYESSVMWDAYSNSNGGVLIETTFQALVNSIMDTRLIYGSKVIYGRNKMPLDNIYYPLFYKREEFRDEREFRLFIAADLKPHIPIKIPYTNPSLRQLPVSQKISVDVSKMIKKSYLHPLTPDWVVESIQGVVKQYGEKFVPIKSSLYT